MALGGVKIYKKRVENPKIKTVYMDLGEKAIATRSKNPFPIFSKSELNLMLNGYSAIAIVCKS